MDASERLIRAAKSGNMKEVKKLISQGALFTKDEFGNTALHEAAWSGNSEIVKLLLKSSCFVDSVNLAGFTPLHLACQNGHAKVAKILLKSKANASIKNQHDECPLHLAAKYDHAHLVPVFTAAKVNLDLLAKDQNTALHIAAKLGNIATLKSLIQNGANPNITNEKRKLPIDYADLGKYKDAVKILFPFTERSTSLAGGNGVGQPPLPTQQLDVELSKEAKGRRSFFKGRSPKSPKDSSKTKVVAKQVTSAVLIGTNAHTPLRQRSHSIATTAAFKRYSREFEDISPLLFARNSAGSIRNPSPLVTGGNPTRIKTRSPSLEELLEEVERETNGENYRYVPPPSSESDTSSVGSQQVNRLSHGNAPPTPNNNNNYNFHKTPKLSPNHSPSPGSKSGNQSDGRILYKTPDVFLKPKMAPNEFEKIDDDYVCLRPASETHRRTITDRNEKNTYSVPLIPDDVLSHTYEYLPPLSNPAGKVKIEEGFDSYIEMAPQSESQRPKSTPMAPSSPLKFSPVKKVAMLTNDPPEVTMTTKQRLSTGEAERTPKSILTNFDSEKRNSELDRYLQDELDTIRQAFQIRLTQMEKRYKRHLASVSSVQKTSSNGLVFENDTLTRQPNRRASWHTDKQQDMPPKGHTHSMSSGFESGSDESLVSSVADSDVMVGENPISERVENSNDHAHLSEFGDDNNATLPNEFKMVIEERMKQYKSQMMQMWMKEAEEKMAAMEQEYVKKMTDQTFCHLKPNTDKVVDRSETFV